MYIFCIFKLAFFFLSILLSTLLFGSFLHLSFPQSSFPENTLAYLSLPSTRKSEKKKFLQSIFILVTHLLSKSPKTILLLVLKLFFFLLRCLFSIAATWLLPQKTNKQKLQIVSPLLQLLINF